MAAKDKMKELAFQLWLSGKPLDAIQNRIKQISTTLPGSVRGWVLDWERGKQGRWEPDRAE
jgi:hypothetical protein